MRRQKHSPISPRSEQARPLKGNANLVVKQFQRDFLTGTIPPPCKNVLISSTLPPIPVQLSARADQTSPSSGVSVPGRIDTLHNDQGSSSSDGKTLLSSTQRGKYPQSARAPDAFLGWQDKASARWLASRLRVHDLVDGFEAQRKTTLASFRAHCSPNVQDPAYDAIDGAENALLYIPHTITDEDFHPLAKVAEFDSKFVEIMAVFLAKGFHDVLRPGADTLDTEALAQLTRKVAEDVSLRKDPSSPSTPRRQQQQPQTGSQPALPPVDNIRSPGLLDKKKLYKSFRNAYRGAEPDDDAVVSAWSKSRNVSGELGVRRDKGLSSSDNDD